MQDKFEAMIYAYSLGCLSFENLKGFNEYLSTGEDFNYSELGELQNLCSLIPCALPLQDVNPAVKDNVARRLYGLRNDIKKIRAQYKGEILQTPDNFDTESQLTSSLEDQDKNFLDQNEVKENDIIILKPRSTTEFYAHEINSGNKKSTRFTAYNPQKESEVTSEKENIDDGSETSFAGRPSFNGEELNPEPKTENQFYKGPEEKNTSNKKNYGLIISSFFLFFIVVIGVIFIYFKLTSEVKNTKKELDSLKGKISNLTMQLSSSQEIQQMLESPNVTIVNLAGTDLNSSGYGKLIISPESGRGYIQLAQMPALPDNSVYLLWHELSGKYVQLGAFSPTESIGYYSFNITGLKQRMEGNFVVTREPSDAKNYVTPGNIIFLTGKF